jgi:hypothetical protein
MEIDTSIKAAFIVLSEAVFLFEGKGYELNPGQGIDR